LVEYSIAEGVINHYHAYIKPNPAPMGYRSKCKEEEKEGHKIPYDNFEKAKPCDLVFEEITNFLHSTSDESYPLFCLNKDIEETRFALNFLRDSKKGFAENFENQRVLPLESLLIYIASLKKCEISNYSATNILTAYTYDYTPTSRCKFHEEEDVIKCAIGCSKRYSFLISDYICHLYNVKLTDNHIPMEKSVSVQGKVLFFEIKI
jgi:protein maelstrom